MLKGVGVFDDERVRREEVLAPEEIGMVMEVVLRKFGRQRLVSNGEEERRKLGFGGGLEMWKSRFRCYRSVIVVGPGGCSLRLEK